MFENTTLYVPQGTIDKYQATDGWNKFLHIEELNSSNMCVTPTISYKNGKLSYNCETEGAICHTTITNEDIKSFDGNEIDLTVTYNISVYATKDGYFDSDVATINTNVSAGTVTIVKIGNKSVKVVMK